MNEINNREIILQKPLLHLLIEAYAGGKYLNYLE